LEAGRGFHAVNVFGKRIIEEGFCERVVTSMNEKLCFYSLVERFKSTPFCIAGCYSLPQKIHMEENLAATFSMRMKIPS